MTALIAALAFVVTQTSATIQWQPPMEGTPHYYEVEVAESGGDDQIFVTTQPSITLDFAVSQDFSVRVSACAAGMCSAWSEPSQVFSLNFSADLSGDSVVGNSDYRLLLPQLGLRSSDDLSGDGLIGITDFNLWHEKSGLCIGPVSVNGSSAQAYLFCGLVSR
jgi:hypothetical protein